MSHQSPTDKELLELALQLIAFETDLCEMAETYDCIYKDEDAGLECTDMFDSDTCPRCQVKFLMRAV